MVMTEEGYRNWVADPETPNQILQVVLQEHTLHDWPLPSYLLEDLYDLSRTEKPAQGALDEARIPLLNWFRQQREELQAEAQPELVSGADDVLGPIGA